MTEVAIRTVSKGSEVSLRGEPVTILEHHPVNDTTDIEEWTGRTRTVKGATLVDLVV